MDARTGLFRSEKFNLLLAIVGWTIASVLFLTLLPISIQQIIIFVAFGLTVYTMAVRIRTVEPLNREETESLNCGVLGSIKFRFRTHAAWIDPISRSCLIAQFTLTVVVICLTVIQILSTAESVALHTLQESATANVNLTHIEISADAESKHALSVEGSRTLDQGMTTLSAVPEFDTSTYPSITALPEPTLTIILERPTPPDPPAPISTPMPSTLTREEIVAELDGLPKPIKIIDVQLSDGFNQFSEEHVVLRTGYLPLNLQDWHLAAGNQEMCSLDLPHVEPFSILVLHPTEGEYIRNHYYCDSTNPWVTEPYTLTLYDSYHHIVDIWNSNNFN